MKIKLAIRQQPNQAVQLLVNSSIKYAMTPLVSQIESRYTNKKYEDVCINITASFHPVQLLVYLSMTILATKTHMK